MIIVVNADQAELAEPHDYTCLRVQYSGERAAHAAALQRSGLGRIDHEGVRLHIPALARSLRMANAYTRHWFEVLVATTAARNWTRHGEDLIHRQSLGAGRRENVTLPVS